MRQHTFLFLLFLRHTGWRILLLLGLLGAAEGAVILLGPGLGGSGLPSFLAQRTGPMGLLALLAFCLLSALLLTATLGWGKNRPDYTLGRLPVAPGWLVFWQGLYNTLAYLLFWFLQALVLLGACWQYTHLGGALGPQSLYLAVWGEPLFHTFLPLDRPLGWVRNLLAAGGLGFTGACFTAELHRGGWNLAFFPLAVGLLLLVLAEGALPLIFLSLICTVAALLSFWHSGKESTQNETELS